jgi:hypothetical protein
MPPITEDKITHDEMMIRQRKGFLCAECNALLTVCWGGAFGYDSYILRCSKDVNHTGIAKKAELSALQTPDELQIGYGRLAKIRRSKLEKEIGKEKGTALAPYAGKGYLTKIEAREIIATIWPEAVKEAPAVVERAIMLCAQYGANPLRKHLFLVPYKNQEGRRTWEIIEGIDFARIAVRRKIEYSYLDDTPRIMTEEEETRIYRKLDPNKVRAICRLKDLKNGAIYPGYGECNGSGIKGLDKGNSAENMSMIRAERSALKRMAPDALPDDVQTMDTSTMQIPKVTVTEDGRQVDTNTGEITQILPLNAPQATEGEFTPVPEESTTPEPEAAPEVKQSESDKAFNKLESASEVKVPAEEKPKKNGKKYFDPANIKNIGDLFQACFDNLNMSRFEVMAEANIKSPSELTDLPAVAYQKIAAPRVTVKG